MANTIRNVCLPQLISGGFYQSLWRKMSIRMAQPVVKEVVVRESEFGFASMGGERVRMGGGQTLGHPDYFVSFFNAVDV